MRPTNVGGTLTLNPTTKRKPSCANWLTNMKFELPNSTGAWKLKSDE
jgi:hypothetical protein